MDDSIGNTTDIHSMDREDLEKSILEHFHTITLMKYRLNALSPVSRLPTELLSDIFLRYVALMLGPDYSATGFPVSPYSWLTIAHVCHHWRIVATNTPALWTNIALTNSPECVQAILERSKIQPLDVSIADPDYDPRFESFRVIMKEFSRFHSLKLRVAGDVYDRIRDLAPRSAPSLTSVSLYKARGPAISSFFQNCHMPSLHTLQIFGGRVDWASPIFKPTLTKLVLYNVKFPHVAFRLLESLPELKHLDATSTSFEPSPHSVKLPKLEYLRITGPAEMCASLFGRADFPTSATVSLCFSSIYSDDIESATTDFASKVKHLNGNKPYRTLSLWRNRAAGNHYYLDLWTDVHDITTLGAQDTRVPPFRLIFPSSRSVLSAITEHTLPSLSLNKIESLYLGDLWNHGCLGDILASFPNVTAIRASNPGLGGSGFDQVESADGATSDRDRKEERLLVRLKTLVLEQVGAGEPGSPGDENAAHRFYEQILNKLKFKDKNGKSAVAATLVLKNCLFIDEKVEKMVGEELSQAIIEEKNELPVGFADFPLEETNDISWHAANGLPAILGLNI